MSDAQHRALERAWLADPTDLDATDRLLVELRRRGDVADPVRHLSAQSDAPWARLLQASLPIERRWPGPPASGRRLHVLGRRGAEHHVARLDVFEDGAIDLGGFVDRALLEEQLRGASTRPAVLTRVPAGEVLHLLDLGRAVVMEPAWSATPADVGVAVDAVLGLLRDPRHPLLDLGGEPTHVVDGERRPKLDPSDAAGVRRTPHLVLRGVALPLLRRSAGGRTLCPWIVYEDERSQLGLDGPLVPIDELGDLVWQGDELGTRARDGERLVLPGLGSFMAAGAAFGLDPRDRVVEARDVPDTLFGRPGVVERCRQVWLELLEAEADDEPADEVEQLRNALRTAYLAVPAHLRERLPAELRAEVPPA
jgi:hypothetical protein